MAATRRRPTGSVATLLAIVVCMAVCTDMASGWWANVCTRGDTYIERNIKGATSCDSCTNWCKNMCSTVGGSVLKNPCQPSAMYNCQCCCSKPPTSAPSLPPTPSSATPFTIGNLDSVCTSEQTYLMIPHTQGSDCALKPQCEEKCKEKGAFVSAGSQCIGTSGDGEEKSYSWIEQCCCKAAPPPTPCPCPSCCGSDINIQISVTSGGCGATPSAPSTCGAKSSTPSTTYLSL
ncbi:hypothetical protein MKW94_011707 [Papaver nudicaule]|uniref:Uncharacterized protein n=1 Tax=Papaver nudicaule TaxID=74823 RepID=A0AA42AXJ1_PAPNU|nr:hypothetical protein [Papaver nudicaule]